MKLLLVIVAAWLIASMIGGAEAIYMHSANIKAENIMMPQMLVGGVLLITAGIIYDEGKKKASKCLVVMGGILLYASINIINVIYAL